jgi:hypothetical protein
MVGVAGSGSGDGDQVRVFPSVAFGPGVWAAAIADDQAVGDCWPFTVEV